MGKKRNNRAAAAVGDERAGERTGERVGAATTTSGTNSPSSPNRFGTPTKGISYETLAEGFGAHPDENEMDEFMNRFNRKCAGQFVQQVGQERDAGYKRTTEFGFADLTPFITNGFEAIVSDSFTQCFQSKPRIRWNHTLYLAPLYYLGMTIRYGVLLPLRLTICSIGLFIFAMLFFISCLVNKDKRRQIQEFAITIVAYAFLMSWCAVVREHGTPPLRAKGQIYVANHTSVIDIVMLLRRMKLSLTGQKHTGGIGFFQDYILPSMENVWFDRAESRDRSAVAQKIRERANDITKPPLLVFPEGTCVNNEYVVMFKRGAFELADVIIPVAIKYNKIFVDAFWNSQKETFLQHLFSLWTSWAVVVDIHYLEPQYREPGESAIAFAHRVKELIAAEANLKSVPWDGYLKRYKPKPEFKKSRQLIYEQLLHSRFGDKLDPYIKHQEEEDVQAAKKEGEPTSAPTEEHEKPPPKSPPQLLSRRVASPLGMKTRRPVAVK